MRAIALLKRHLLNRPTIQNFFIRTTVSKKVSQTLGLPIGIKTKQFKFNMGTSFSSCCLSAEDEEREAILDTTNRLIEVVEREQSRSLNNRNDRGISNATEKCFEIVSDFASEGDEVQYSITSQAYEKFMIKTLYSMEKQNENSSHDDSDSNRELHKRKPDQQEHTAEVQNGATKCKRSKNKERKRKNLVSEEDVEKKKPKRPNYFVAFKISNPEIHSNMEKIQNHIIEQDARFAACMIPLPTLHITLVVMHIADSEEHSRALMALNEIHKEFNSGMSDSPLGLEFKGLGHFRNQVVYAKLSPGDTAARLNSIVENIKTHFENYSITTTDKRDFSPHLTLMKLSRDPKMFRKGIKKINPSLYKSYADQLFGNEVVEGIQLLSMTGPKDGNGYYTGHELLFDIHSK